MPKDSAFICSLDSATKEEKKFLNDIVKMLHQGPYSLRVVMVVDARDNTRNDFAGIITGCCRACARDLIIDAANTLTDQDEYDVIVDDVVVQ